MRYSEIVMAESSKIALRYQMVRVSREEGVSEAGRRFGASRRTVRKWRDRFEAEGMAGLKDRSRAPKRIGHKSPKEVEDRVLSLRDRYPGWGVDRMGLYFDLGCSRSAASRILRQAGRTRRRRKKRNRNDLRKEKARLAPFEKIQIDTKDLSDIGRYREGMWRAGLPRYQYTGRDVRTGAAWFCWAQTNDSFQGALFASVLLGHLDRHGVDLGRTTIQTDNGSEYVGSATKGPGKRSMFEQVVKTHTGHWPVTIFPGSKTSQSDVESFHGLIEEELYEVEDLSTRRRLVGKGRTYQAYFNHLRKNRWKGGKTPAMILAEAGSRVDPRALTLPPIPLDTIPLQPITTAQGGNHVPVLVKIDIFRRREQSRKGEGVTRRQSSRSPRSESWNSTTTRLISKPMTTMARSTQKSHRNAATGHARPMTANAASMTMNSPSAKCRFRFIGSPFMVAPTRLWVPA
ncbi:MAG: helix-turn-helix domain-containing protein [Planctomycetes bacterium]|nr:helix-turn-helix domain-containing protein [Planctomycetota bacterium]